MLRSTTVRAFLRGGATLVVLVLLPSASARADLLAFFDFNDASDPDVAVDISGNGNHGVVDLAEYTAAGEGRTGGADDRAMDFGDAGNGAVVDVPSAFDGALESLVENDTATVTLWMFGGDQNPVNNVHFYIGSDGTQVDGDARELLAHIPWGNGNIYFDVSGCCGADTRITANEPDDTLYMGEWNHYAFVKDGSYSAIYQNGELWLDSGADEKRPLRVIDIFTIGADSQGGNSAHGLIDDFGLWDEPLGEEEIRGIMENGVGTGDPKLRAGDANMDLEFNQLDLVQVQIHAKYLTGTAATWGEGDWDGAPGGRVGDPPAGDGLFNQLDIIAALNAGTYLTGPYAALAGPAPAGGGTDEQTSILYNPSTGELGVNAPASTNLTSVNIDSAAAIFTGNPAENLGGSFDNDSDQNIFKATFGGSFGTLSFGNVAQAGLSRQFVIDDLTVVGSLEGGGDLGAVDLIYIPEPSNVVLLALGLAGLAIAYNAHKTHTWRPRVRFGKT